MVIPKFKIDDIVKVLVNGYSYRAKVLEVLDNYYVVNIVDNNDIKDNGLKINKSQCFHCSYYWYN